MTENNITLRSDQRDHLSARREVSQGTRSALFAITLGVAALWASTVSAQNQKVEITPTLAYSFGSNFEIDDFDFGLIGLDVEDGDTAGLTLDFTISRSLQLELFYLTQDTDLELDTGFLDPGEPLGGLDLDYIHGGVLWQLNAGQIKPFLTLTGGITRIDAEIGGDSETRPSIGAGGGIKIFFTDHIGFRAEGRYLVTILDEDDDFDCCADYSDDNLTQGVVGVGLIIAF